MKLTTSNRIVQTLFWFQLGFILFLIGYSIKLLFGILLSAVLISTLLKPSIDFGEAKGLSRDQSLIVLFVGIMLIMTFIALTLLPMLLTQLQSFLQNLPRLMEALTSHFSELYEQISLYFPQLELPPIQSLLERFIHFLRNIVGGLGTITSGLLSSLSALLITPIVTFYFLKDGPLIHKYTLSLIPNRYFEMSALLISHITKALQNYLRGQILDSSFVGGAIALGLSIMGFPYALLIGLIAGIGNLIPYLGPILGFIPVVVVSFMVPEWQSISGLLGIGLLFLVVQTIESLFIYPNVVGKSIKMHPLIVILGILVGGKLGGIVGMLIAIPFLAISLVSLSLFHRYLKAYRIL